MPVVVLTHLIIGILIYLDIIMVLMVITFTFVRETLELQGVEMVLVPMRMLISQQITLFSLGNIQQPPQQIQLQQP